MGVLMTNSGRGDIAFDHGRTFKWAVRWRRSSDGGRVYDPVDLSAYDVRFQLTGMDGIVWVDKPCETQPSKGIAICRLDPGDTDSDVWRGRRSGTWRCVASQPDGEALSAVWNPEDTGLSGSLLQSIPDIEQGESTIIAWGYWRAA